jgi:hypothetical protein
MPPSQPASIRSERPAPNDFKPPPAEEDQPTVFQPAKRSRREATQPRQRRKKERRGFAADLGAAFLFVTDLDSGAMFAIVWLALAIQAFVLPFLFIGGIIVSLLIYAWYSAYRFSVIAAAASGDRHLPKGSVDEVALRLVQWVGTWALALLPAFVYLVATHDLSALERMSESMGDGDFFSQIDSIPFYVLLWVGLFLWPLMALCVAMGGISALSRPDLIVWTAIKTLPIYLPIDLFVVVALVVRPVAAELQARIGIVGTLVMIGVGVYLELVAMQVIGLYYHHYKRRFAWSWG